MKNASLSIHVYNKISQKFKTYHKYQKIIIMLFINICVQIEQLFIYMNIVWQINVQVNMGIIIYYNTFLLLFLVFNIKIYEIMLAKSKSAANYPLAKNSQINKHILCVESSRKSKISTTNSQLRLKKSIACSNLKLPFNSVANGKTIEFHESRRENYLNTFYNKRKNQLIGITKENRKIYDRINSQKSLYSSRAMNKSYDSICSKDSRVSNRSNKSKVSKISNINKTSRQTSNNKIRIRSQARKQNKVQPVFQAHNINLIKKQQIVGFHNMFSTKNQPTKQKSKSRVTSKQYQDENMMEEIKQFPKISNRKSLGKFAVQQTTPDRAPKLSERNHNISTGLPILNEKTPVRASALQKIIQSITRNSLKNRH